MHVLWANPWLKESLLCTKIAAASSVCCTTVQNVLSYVSALCQDWQWPFTFIIMVLVRHISGRDTSIIYLQHSHFRNIFCASKNSLCRPGPSALGKGLVSNKFIPWSPKVVILTYFQQTSKLPLVSRTWKSIDVQFSILSISLLGLYINIRNIKLFTYLLIRVNIQS